MHRWTRSRLISAFRERRRIAGFQRSHCQTRHEAFSNERKKAHLIDARKKAVIWHNAEKAKRMEAARMTAEESLSHIDTRNRNILELALAMLYLGEGSKTKATGMGNSDPLIIKFFIESLYLLYGIEAAGMRFDLHLRADQNPDKMKSFWSDELNVPLDKFKTVSVDKRTLGKKTYRAYRGVCAVDCGDVAIQRKLVYLSRTFCKSLQKRIDIDKLKRD